MGGRRKQTSENSLKGHRMSPIRNGRGVNERKYNMNTKGKIDFTKTDNIQFIEEVAREISKEDKDWQWEVRKIKQHSLLLWWELLEGSGQEGFRIEYDEANEVFSVYDEWSSNITYELEDTLDLKSTMRSVFWYASSRY